MFPIITKMIRFLLFFLLVTTASADPWLKLTMLVERPKPQPWPGAVVVVEYFTTGNQWQQAHTGPQDLQYFTHQYSFELGEDLNPSMSTNLRVSLNTNPAENTHTDMMLWTGKVEREIFGGVPGWPTNILLEIGPFTDFGEDPEYGGLEQDAPKTDLDIDGGEGDEMRAPVGAGTSHQTIKYWGAYGVPSNPWDADVARWSYKFEVSKSENQEKDLVPPRVQMDLGDGQGLQDIAVTNWDKDGDKATFDVPVPQNIGYNDERGIGRIEETSEMADGNERDEDYESVEWNGSIADRGAAIRRQWFSKWDIFDEEWETARWELYIRFYPQETGPTVVLSDAQTGEKIGMVDTDKEGETTVHNLGQDPDNEDEQPGEGPGEGNAPSTGFTPGSTSIPASTVGMGGQPGTMGGRVKGWLDSIVPGPVSGGITPQANWVITIPYSQIPLIGMPDAVLNITDNETASVYIPIWRSIFILVFGCIFLSKSVGQVIKTIEGDAAA